MNVPHVNVKIGFIMGLECAFGALISLHIFVMDCINMSLDMAIIFKLFAT